jgi:hypothetical protein
MWAVYLSFALVTFLGLLALVLRAFVRSSRARRKLADKMGELAKELERIRHKSQGEQNYKRRGKQIR